MTEPAKATPAKKAAAKKPAETPAWQRTPAQVWEALAAPFPQDELEKLPRNLKARDENKGRCEDTGSGRYYSADGHYCGGWHSRSVHLDYVGHAGITMRLNDVLGPTGWELKPMGVTPEGLPVITQSMFWATLSVTVDGVTATKMDVAADFKGPQEALGDVLRRCAMRFGVGTYLWSKSEAALELKKATDQPPEPPAQEQAAPAPAPVQEQAPPPTDQEPVHVVMARQLISSLTEPERAIIGPWWDKAAEQGHLPLKSNLGAMTPAQTAWLEEVVGNMREMAAAEERQRQYAAQQASAQPEAQPDPS